MHPSGLCNLSSADSKVIYHVTFLQLITIIYSHVYLPTMRMGPVSLEKVDNYTQVSLMRLITVRMGHVPFSKLITVRMGRVSLTKLITETTGHVTLTQLTNSMIESFRIASSFLFYCDTVGRVIQEHVSCPCGSGFASFPVTIYDFCKLFTACIQSTREGNVFS